MNLFKKILRSVKAAAPSFRLFKGGKKAGDIKKSVIENIAGFEVGSGGIDHNGYYYSTSNRGQLEEWIAGFDPTVVGAYLQVALEGETYYAVLNGTSGNRNWATLEDGKETGKDRDDKDGEGDGIGGGGLGDKDDKDLLDGIKKTFSIPSIKELIGRYLGGKYDG